jgi:hypothetical protein
MTIQRERSSLLKQTTTPIDVHIIGGTTSSSGSSCYYHNCWSMIQALTKLSLWSRRIILLLGALLLALYLIIIIINPAATSFSMKSISSATSTLTKNDNKTNRFPSANSSASDLSLLELELELEPTATTVSKTQGLLRGKQPATTTSTIKKKKEKMKLSLWLIPPGGGGEEETDDDDNENENNNHNHNHNVYKSTKDIINELAKEYNGPKFIPHITIVGGIEVDTEEDAIILSKKLIYGLENSNSNSKSNSNSIFKNGIECTFNSILVEEPSCWNQAMIIEMKISKSFTKLCKLCRTILNMEQQHGDGSDCITFPPPAKVPHMSLYYGLSPNVPSSSIIDLSRIFGTTNTTNTTNNNNNNNNNNEKQQQKQNNKQSFQSYRVMLWKTDPASVEGVPEWTPIADINLS